MTGVRLSRAELRRAVARHRALLAGGLAAGAVASGLGVLAPEPTAGQPALRAHHDLAAGAALTAADLDVVRMPADVAPSGLLVDPAAAIGRVLAAPVRKGEVLTDVRLAGAALLGSGTSGLVAVPVRLADATTAALLHAGDRIDVLAASTGRDTSDTARVVAIAAMVLAVPATANDSAEGALVVLAETPTVAARLAAAAVTSRLSFTLRAAA